MKKSIMLMLLLLTFGVSSAYAGDRDYFKGRRGDKFNLPVHNSIGITRNDSIPTSVILYKQININNVNSISENELFYDAFSFYYFLLKKYKFKDIGRSSISYVVFDGTSKSFMGPNFFYTMKISDLKKLNNRGFDAFDLDKSIKKEILPIKEVLKNIVVIDASSGGFSVNSKKTNSIRSSLDGYDFPGGIESGVENNFYSKQKSNSVSGITPQDGNEKKVKKVYTIHCTDGNYGIVTEEKGMVCADAGNTKPSKCSHNWSISLASSYICK
jgi:hypothetical protein